MLQLAMTIGIMAVLYWLLATFVFWKKEDEVEVNEESTAQSKKSKIRSKRRK